MYEKAVTVTTQSASGAADTTTVVPKTQSSQTRIRYISVYTSSYMITY